MDLLDSPISASVIESLSWTMARLYEVVPVKVSDGEITIATWVDHVDELLSELRTFTGVRFHSVRVSEQQIRVALDRYYPEPPCDENSIRQAIAAAKTATKQVRERVRDIPTERLLEVGRLLVNRLSNQEVAHVILRNPKFCAQMIEGDELWSYSNSKEDWDRLGGEGGYAIVRGGNVVDFQMTMMN